MKVNSLSVLLSLFLLSLRAAPVVIFAQAVAGGDADICNVCGPDGNSIGEPAAVLIYEIDNGLIKNDAIKSTCKQAQEYVKFRKITTTDAFCDYIIKIAMESCKCATPKGESLLISSTSTIAPTSRSPSFSPTITVSPSPASSTVPSMAVSYADGDTDGDAELSSFARDMMLNCLKDLVTSDKNQDASIKYDEFPDLMAQMAARMCSRATMGALQQAALFNSLACLCRERNPQDTDCCLGQNAQINISGIDDGEIETFLQDDYLRAVCGAMNNFVVCGEDEDDPASYNNNNSTSNQTQPQQPPTSTNRTTGGPVISPDFPGIGRNDSTGGGGGGGASDNGGTPPVNDRCTSAAKIEFDSQDNYYMPPGANYTFQFEGTTVDATYDSELYDRGCDPDGDQSKRGVWYSFEGTTGQVTVTMIRADARFGMALFYGYSCGTQLRCYGNTYESSYTIYTRAGQIYYLLIFGMEPDSVINSFSLRVSSAPRPTLPPRPTPAPTPPPATMSDQCETALAIPSLPYTVSGSTQGASSDFPITSCGVTTSNSSVWFQLKGTGRAVNATIGYVYGTITILSGDSCGFQDCVGYQTGYERSYYSRRLASYTWIAEQDTTYYIRVSGNDNNVLYRFTLQVFEYDTPTNDDCSGAELVSSFPYTTRGTTRGSLTDFGLPTCGLSSNSRGVWYRIPGNGSVMRANAVAEFSSGIRLALFSGECGFLICRNDQASVQYESRSSVDWFTEEGRDDYLLVTGYNEEEVGEFQVSFSFSEPPVNNQCNNATLIPGGSGTAAAKPYVDRGTTIGSFPDMSSVLCGDSLVGQRGVWYKFIGEGKVASLTFTLSVAGYTSSSSSYGVASVFSGDCDFLSCVQSSRSSYGSGVSLDWVAENGTTYFILLTGHEFKYVGPYSFSLVQRETLSNGACQNPVQITSMPFRSVGTIAGATISTPDCFSSSYASRGVWYSFEGSGKWMRSTLVLNYDTDYRGGYVNVFTGMCDFLECEAMATRDSQGGYVHNTWFAQANTTYYIMVTDGDRGSSSSSSSVGNFELQLTEFLPPENDKCENATSFTLLPSVLSGAMRGATPALEFPACGVEPSSPGIWYSVVGTGKSSKFEVSMSPDSTSLSGSNSYSSYVDIAVFSGSICDELDCVRNNKVYISSSSRNNGPHPSVDWFAAKDVTYRILVAWDQWVQGGNLKARITDFDPPSNSDCNSATNIVILPFTKIGNTEGSSENYLSSTCGYSYSTNSSTRGVWYSLTGSGRNITASLRGYFNTQLSVFTGSCQTFNCVAFARSTSDLTSSAEVTWTATPYMKYNIYVSGQDFSDTGKYQLKVVGIGPETVTVQLKGTAFSFKLP